MTMRVLKIVRRARQLLCGVLLVCWSVVCSPVWAQNRVALVIGNAAYSAGPLTNPPKDAAVMAGALKAIGFKVTTLLNGDQKQMKRAVRDFGTAAQGADIAFMYYSGHGTQVSGENYLLPVGATIEKEGDYSIEAVAANDVLEQIRGARARAAILVLDACRDNPLASVTKTTTKGLGRMNAPTGTMIAFATQPNNTAQDDGNYARTLAKELTKPGQELLEVFRNTGAEIKRLSGGKQEPRISEISINERIYLASLKPEAVPILQPVPVPEVSLEDLQKEEEARKKRWEQWQKRMKENYEKTASFKASADLRVKAWERFLATWSENNPLSDEDESLRSQGQGELDKAKQEVANAAAAANARPVAVPVAAGSTDFGIKMVSIPGGSFTMGSTEAEQKQAQADGVEKERTDRENPQHQVTVGAFAMGETEVTQGQWKAVMGETEVTQGQWKAVMGSAPPELWFKKCGDNCPVENVSWDDIQGFLTQLNQKTGKVYRLPSEAEWEYACRAGKQQRYCGSDDVDSVGWYDGNSGNKTHPVKQKQANAWGLYDMSGNVWEWTQDCWHDDYKDAPTDGSAWTTGCSSNSRVLRGGSWGNKPASLRSAGRIRGTPDGRDGFNGFRLVRTLFTP